MLQREQSKFSTVWTKGTVLAESVNSVLSKPRTAGHSTYHCNAGCHPDGSGGAMEYFQRKVFFPCIDHCVAQFEQRFPDVTKSLYLGYKLLPSKIHSLSTEDVQDITLAHVD